MPLQDIQIGGLVDFTNRGLPAMAFELMSFGRIGAHEMMSECLVFLCLSFLLKIGTALMPFDITLKYFIFGRQVRESLFI